MNTLKSAASVRLQGIDEDLGIVSDFIGRITSEASKGTAFKSACFSNISEISGTHSCVHFVVSTSTNGGNDLYGSVRSSLKSGSKNL